MMRVARNQYAIFPSARIDMPISVASLAITRDLTAVKTANMNALVTPNKAPLARPLIPDEITFVNVTVGKNHAPFAVAVIINKIASINIAVGPCIAPVTIAKAVLVSAKIRVAITPRAADPSRTTHPMSAVIQNFALINLAVGKFYQLVIDFLVVLSFYG